MSDTVQLLRIKDVESRVGLKKSAIYQRVARGEFPRPVLLSSRATRWMSSDIERWIAERVQAVAA